MSSLTCIFHRCKWNNTLLIDSTFVNQEEKELFYHLDLKLHWKRIIPFCQELWLDLHKCQDCPNKHELRHLECYRHQGLSICNKFDRFGRRYPRILCLLLRLWHMILYHIGFQSSKAPHLKIKQAIRLIFLEDLEKCLKCQVSLYTQINLRNHKFDHLLKETFHTCLDRPSHLHLGQAEL